MAASPGTKQGSDDTARRFGIAVVVVLGGLIALNLLASGVDHAVGGSEPSGVAGSSYGTQDTGLGGARGARSRTTGIRSRASAARSPTRPSTRPARCS